MSNWKIERSRFMTLYVKIGIAKVSSHIEGCGTDAVQNQWAYLCDIVGNALADEAAEQAAKTFQPSKQDCLNSEELSRDAFLICIRLAFTQARVGVNQLQLFI